MEQPGASSRTGKILMAALIIVLLLIIIAVVLALLISILAIFGIAGVNA